MSAFVDDFGGASFQCAVRFLYLLLVSAINIMSSDALGIYLLNLLLAFLQPKFDPSLEADLAADEIEEGGADDMPSLPSQKDDEFRPFVRRLPEWNFWCVKLRSFDSNGLLTAINDEGCRPLALYSSHCCARSRNHSTYLYIGQYLLFTFSSSSH